MATYFHVVDDVIVNLIEADPQVVDSLGMDGELIEHTDEGFSGDIGESWSVLVDEHERNVALTSERFAEIDNAIDLAFAPLTVTATPVFTRHGTRSIDG